jgi:hypothetical protein
VPAIYSRSNEPAGRCTTAAGGAATDTCVRCRARLAVSGRFPETLCFSFPRRWPTGAAIHEAGTAERADFFLFGASTAERDDASSGRHATVV